MGLTSTQKQDILQVIDKLWNSMAGRRLISQMFRTLPDPVAWKAYYDVIPQPRSLESVKADVEKNKIPRVEQARTDLDLIFKNALHFNEEGSAISLDARILQGVLEQEWASKPSLQLHSRSKAPVGSASSPTPGPSSVPSIKVKSSPAVTPTLSHAEVTKAISNIPYMSFPPHASRSSSYRDESVVERVDIEGEEDSGTGPEALVRRTEARLQNWPGPSTSRGTEDGWMAPVKGDAHAKYVEIILLLKNYRVAASGDRPADSLEGLAESTNILHLYHHDPISFILIEDRALSSYYTTAQAFDQDLYRLFEKGRRVYYGVDDGNYGRVLLLQRMYHHLTSPIALQVPAMTRAKCNFASTDLGPGRNKKGKSKACVPIQDSDSAEHITYKGQTYRVGDYIHLMNPDDPRKPIVGQIFGVHIRKGEADRQSVNVRWYLLPEQTVHPRDSMFYAHEVFATGCFTDHAVEDIIEKVGVQFREKYVLGRLLSPLWYPGWPLYICESWYSGEGRVFSKIEDWLDWMPQKLQEVAKANNSDVMPILPYDGARPNSVIHLTQTRSPFVVGAEKGIARTNIGPGMLSDGLPPPLTIGQEKVSGDGDQGDKAGGPAEVSVRYTPRSRWPSSKQAANHQHKRKVDDRSIVTAAGGAAYLKDAKIAMLPKETVEKFDRDPKTGNLLWFSGAPIVAPDPSAYRPRYSLEYLAFLARKRKESSPDGVNTDGHILKRTRQSNEMEATETYKPAPQLLNELVVSPDGSLSYDPSSTKEESLDGVTLSRDDSTALLVKALQNFSDHIAS